LLSFMVTTAHPGFQMLWRSERFADTEDGQAEVRRSAEARLDGSLSELDKELGDRPALLGEGFSVADAYLFVIGRWGLRLTKPTTAYDRLWKFTRTVAEMGATRRALAREGISLIGPSSGLG
jgi:glutathione S-transferase